MLNWLATGVRVNTVNRIWTASQKTQDRGSLLDCVRPARADFRSQVTSGYLPDGSQKSTLYRLRESR